MQTRAATEAWTADAERASREQRSQWCSAESLAWRSLVDKTCSVYACRPAIECRRDHLLNEDLCVYLIRLARRSLSSHV